MRYSPRPSVNRSASGEAETLAAQVERCKAFAAEHGMTVLAVRSDEEKTGRGNGKNRRGLMQAIAECRRAGAVLVVAKLDRLSRDVGFVDSLIKSDVEFRAVDNPHANKLTMQIMAAMSEYESDQISERTRAAMLTMQRNGRMVGSEPPFGWRKSRSFESRKINGAKYMSHMLEADPIEQVTLERIRELRAEVDAGRLSVYGACKVLNGEKRRPRWGKWTNNKLTRIWARDDEAGGRFEPVVGGE